MFTTLINHLLSKLTLGNYLWTLILLASPILLPWILTVAEGCPIHTGTRCCLWPQTAQWTAADRHRTRIPGIYKEGRDFGWAQQRLPGHFSQIVRAGPVEGARCQEMVLPQAVISIEEAHEGQQACSGWGSALLRWGFRWQVICGHPGELAAETE